MCGGVEMDKVIAAIIMAIAEVIEVIIRED